MNKVTVSHKGDLLFEGKVGNHTLLSDVPAVVGGQDRGPTGLELFASSLGCCVAAMVVFYCNRAEIDATDMSVEVTYERASNPVRLTNVQVTLHLPHVADEERRQAILNVARHCPVHETIKSLEQADFTIAD